MPKFLENKLKAEYGQNSKIPYEVMNSIGAMHGNQETAKGREMEKKHEAKMSHGFASTHITHHGDGSHTVEHMPKMKPSKSGAFMQGEGEKTSYSASDGKDLMAKLGQHLDVAAADEPDTDGDSDGD